MLEPFYLPLLFVKFISKALFEVHMIQTILHGKRDVSPCLSPRSGIDSVLDRPPGSGGYQSLGLRHGKRSHLP